MISQSYLVGILMCWSLCTSLSRNLFSTMLSALPMPLFHMSPAGLSASWYKHLQPKSIAKAA